MGINSPVNYRTMARQKAAKYGVDPAIFERQINQESGFQTDRVSPAGATGIAQIMTQYHPGVDATDPEASLDYAARLMAGYLRQYSGDYRLALAAYNAGAGNVAQYGGVPPFEETQRYVANILSDKGAQEGKMAGPPTDAFWDQVQRHGGIVGTSVVNPTVKDPSGIQGLPDTQNPSPTYRYVFADGTYLEGTTRATLDPQTNEWKVESVDITDPGTAMKASPSTATAQWSIQTKADGSKARVNEITGETAPLEGFGPKAPAPQMYTNRQRSDPGDSMSGPSQWNERVPVVDTRMNGRQLWGLPENGTQYEMIQEFPDTSAGDPVGWANLAQRKQEFDQKMAWDRALAEMKAKQDQEQADRSLQTQLTSHINNIWAQNLPRMGDPSQVYFAGAGPGGPLETLFKQGGSTYDPNQGKINWQNFDQNAAWKQAAGMVRR